MNNQVGSSSKKNLNVAYEDLTKILGLSRFDSENLSDVSSTGLPMKCALDPTNSVHMRNITPENGLKSAEVSSDNLQDTSISCESPHSQFGKAKFMCSFGGKIMPRPSDSKLRYVGGETRLISIPRNFSWNELVQKTLKIYNQPHTIKYQLPDEDLDALISLSCDEDLQNMMEEYSSLERANSSPRLRIFLVSQTECEDSSLDSRSLESEPEYQFVVAVNNLAQLKKSISGNNLLSQSSHHLDNSPLPCRDTPVCQTDRESGAKALGGYTVNEAPSQFFISPFTHQTVAESSMTSSPNLNRQRTMKKSRMRLSAEKSTLNQEHEDTSEVYNGSNLETMLPDHQHKKQNDTETGIGAGTSPHHFHIQNQVKDLGMPQNESGLSSLTNYDMPIPVQTPFYSEKVSIHPENSVLSAEGMTHAFSDPLLKDRKQVLAANLSSAADSHIAPISQEIYQTKEPERKLSVTKPDFVRVKPADVARTEEPKCLVSNHTDQPYNQGIVGAASVEPTIHYQQDSLSSNVRKGHDGGSTVQQQDKPYHQENRAGPNVTPRFGFVDTGFNSCHARAPTISSDELDALESSVPTSIPATDHFVNECSVGSQVENSARGSQIDNLNSGGAGADYGTTGCVYGYDKVAPVPHASLPINPFDAFTSQISMANRESSVYQNGKVDQSSVHNYGLDISPLIGISNSDVSANLPSSQNPSPVCVSSREVPLECNIACSHVVNGFDPTFIDNESMKLNDRMYNNVQMEAPVIVEDVTNNVPLGIPSSRPLIPHVEVAAEERQQAIISSLKDDDAKSDGPELANEDHDDEPAADGSISDAAVAELEASMYGLQIIRNADLEELRELGSGTFGTVYHGKWRGTDVAIKRIKKSCFAGRSSEQEKLTKDFWREAKILSKLHHPNVVAFYGVVPDGTGGTLATVTEFMVNGSLRNVLLRKDRMLDRRKRLIIAMDAAFGMEYLHSRSIVHFDLKCDNLLVNLRDPQRPICKVGDFGLSRIKRNTLVSGGVRGTLPWMAPELLNGSSSRVSEKVDVFSFGIALWEILTGEEPYANMHCGAIIGGIVNNTLRPLIPKNCEPEWRKLMEQCWSADPDIRPSFTEVTDRLRAMSSTLQAKGQHQGNK
ncbi:uncharacterized protein LOC102712766 [Oryza brachyantha]|uniref:Protein kinase domain-containing protein n=1 Tax=Oryza brachyantha TaxID=4533 RepID=J3NEN0_ORYBR|nr:uncharacterized protein LOC102712766 [Oryza brachyantha]XP_015698717.1 uncharacterized protein LOC102712766 [Oryza brachyantha]